MINLFFKSFAATVALLTTTSVVADAMPILQIAVPQITLVSAANSQRGQALFRGKCSACHNLDEHGANKTGPNLHGLYGRKAGSLPGYAYSSAMRASSIIWNAEALDIYLTNPRQAVPNDKMAFGGLPNRADRDDLINYLERATQ